MALAAGRADGQGCAPHWTGIGSGIGGPVNALIVHQGRLYAAGNFASAGSGPAANMAAWNGSEWSPVGPGRPAEMLGLATGDLGQGPRLFAVGFPLTGVSSMASWDGAAWTGITGGPEGAWVGCATVHDDGGGPELYVSGGFAVPTSTGLAPYIARWNGSRWRTVADGLGSVVMAFLPWEEPGRGRVLFAAGSLVASAPGTIGIARWDGAAWSSIGDGLNGSGEALALFDDGTGAAVYVGGSFFRAGAVPAEQIARWNGAWSPLGAGLDRGVAALAVFDDGSGPALYAAGRFGVAGGAPASRIARWRNGAWSPLGSGLDGEVKALAVFDPDGAGPAPGMLIAAGALTQAGGAAVSNIAAWVGCGCYANCDASTTSPLLTVGDFACFLNRFAAADPAANCDGSTTPPVLNIHDFTCFVNAFAAGCS
jgi:hypothetical protein